MSLADALAQAKAEPLSGFRCGVYRILGNLGEDAHVLRTYLADPSVPGSVIARVLKAHGHEIEATTIQRHRKHECKCPRDGD